MGQNVEMKSLPSDTSPVAPVTRRLIQRIGAPSPAIDALCHEVGERLGFETVVVSLLDEVRQWFQHASGIVQTDSTEVCWAFCAQTVRDGRFFEVVDARRDGRYANNELVIGEPHIVYYAGVPLTLEDGTRPGALAVIDAVPRPKMSSNDVALLVDYADRVSRELDRSLA